MTCGKYGPAMVCGRLPCWLGRPPRDTVPPSRVPPRDAALLPPPAVIGACRSHTESASPPRDAMKRPYGRRMPFPPVDALEVSVLCSIFSASIFVGAFSLDEEASRFDEWSLLDPAATMEGLVGLPAPAPVSAPAPFSGEVCSRCLYELVDVCVLALEPELRHPVFCPCLTAIALSIIPRCLSSPLVMPSGN